MSADNCVAILATTSSFAHEGGGRYRNLRENTRTHYRVAHTQAIDNFDWYEQNQPYNLGAYMQDVWPKEPIYLTRDDAWKAARDMLDSIEYTEYGIVEIDGTKYHYMGE